MGSATDKTHSRALVDSIARAVSEFDLKPGQRLAEEALARRYRVSRTPVREALKILHEMGLVERLPGGGYAVRVIELEAVADLMVIWETLEDLAIQLASQNSDPASFRRLLEQEREQSDIGPTVAEKFHMELAQLSKNSELVSLLDTIYLRTLPYRRLDGLNRSEEVHADHISILEKLADGNVDGARDIMRTHIGRTRLFVETLIRGGVRSLSFESST